MSQTQRISKNNTTIAPRDGYTTVTLHATDIVKISADRIILNTGGYLTATTCTRINQVANEWNLGFCVGRSKGTFSVRVHGSDHSSPAVASTDNQTFTLSRGPNGRATGVLA
jgi:hypothetical protein